MRLILLTQGKAALVDDSDYDRFGGLNWYYGGNGYASRSVRRNGKTETDLLHRCIAGNPNCEVDHKNGDTLDCRRFNLRIATHQQNAFNQGPKSSNSCGYKGVTWHAKSKAWQVRIRAGGRRILVGYFKDLEKAGEAYREAALKHHKEFARS